MKNHDWILASLVNLMAYAEREGLETVCRTIEQTIIQISPALRDETNGAGLADRNTVSLSDYRQRQEKVAVRYHEPVA